MARTDQSVGLLWLKIQIVSTAHQPVERMRLSCAFVLPSPGLRYLPPCSKFSLNFKVPKLSLFLRIPLAPSGFPEVSILPEGLGGCIEGRGMLSWAELIGMVANITSSGMRLKDLSGYSNTLVYAPVILRPRIV